MIGGLGLSLYQNGGLIVLNNIFLVQWGRGEKLDPAISMSLMAIIFYIFLSVNATTYFGMTVFQ